LQIGTTPACAASEYGHIETLALLLAHKADINAADNVQYFKLFIYLI
jgi:ankyrin repeat protein